MADPQKPVDSPSDQALDTQTAPQGGPAAPKKAAPRTKVQGKPSARGKAQSGVKAAAQKKPPARATAASGKAPSKASAPASAKTPARRRPSGAASAVSRPKRALPREVPQEVLLPASQEPSLPQASQESTPLPPQPALSAPEASVPVDFDQLSQRMLLLQQEIRQLGIPVVILLEGWDAAGKGILLGELLEGLDPRGYKVHVMDSPSQEERRYPAFRRHWVAMPAKGNISLFVGSWYREVSNDCLTDKAARKDLPQRYAQILQLESQLVCDGTLLLKFFLNISKKEQKARLKALESKKSTRWRVTKEAWAQNERYEEMMHLYDAMMGQTDREGALWHVLRSEDKRACKEQMFTLVIDAFTQAIAAQKAAPAAFDVPELPGVQPVPTAPIAPLASFQTFQPDAGDYNEAMDQAQKRLYKLQSQLYRQQVSTVVCFEGWDAAGKGGSILRLTRGLDARGFEVIPTSVPSPTEKSHHHLWRFWRDLSKDGHIAIFDRTWYGRVLVERVEGFCTQAQWQRAYEEINQFELELARHGTIVRKFWLQIDPGEQLARFEQRQSDPQKQWKITQEDWRNRDKWAQYESAVDEMLQRTHTSHAPWIVVEADNKRFARLKVLHTLIEAMEQALAK